MEQNIALFEACRRGNLGEAERLIEAGADVNYRDEKRGETPLHAATQTLNIKLVELLINNGADVNIKDKYGIGPLYVAAVWYNDGRIHDEIVKMLLSKGATIDKKIMDDVKAKRGPGTQKIIDILEAWPRSMAIVALQENQVYNQNDMSYLEDLDQFMGKKGKDFGGKRRRTKRFIKRKSNKRRRTNKRKSNKRR